MKLSTIFMILTYNFDFQVHFQFVFWKCEKNRIENWITSNNSETDTFLNVDFLQKTVKVKNDFFHYTK